MRSGLPALILAGTTYIAAATPAHAVICYVIYDRNENVIYQNTYPPVDMSNAGLAERDALRARGEHLTFGDVPQCPTVVFLIPGGSVDLRVDELVAGLRVRTISGNTAAAAALSQSQGVQPGGPTPTGFRSPVAKPGAKGY